MKRFIGVFILAVSLATLGHAQKFGYVDTEFILGKMEEYKAAKTEIDQLSQKWQKELEVLYADIEKMYKDYQAEEVLLPDDIKKQRQEDIMSAERKAKEFKERKFGYDGELYKVQDDKIKPIQDKVYDAVEKVATERKLDIILDKAANSGILYSNAAFDRTDDVIIKLGIQK
jgi:outer membrane protein